MLLSLALLSLSASDGLAATGLVRLQWTAPGDDGIIGRALMYDVRASKVPITQANFMTATTVYMRIPKVPGTTENLTLQVTPAMGRYFAIRTMDDAGNWSLISNVVQIDARVDAEPQIPGTIQLSTPYPNPARRNTRISLELPQAARCRIEVFDGQGRRVRLLADHVLAPGRSELVWDLQTDVGESVAAGVYFIRAHVGNWDDLKRVAVTR